MVSFHIARVWCGKRGFWGICSFFVMTGFEKIFVLTVRKPSWWIWLERFLNVLDYFRQEAVMSPSWQCWFEISRENFTRKTSGGRHNDVGLKCLEILSLEGHHDGCGHSDAPCLNIFCVPERSSIWTSPQGHLEVMTSSRTVLGIIWASWRSSNVTLLFLDVR
jgi:hypothetical protein